MLQQMRKGAASWLAKGLMFLLVISFGMWGISDYIQVAGDKTVARIGAVTITASQFSSELRRELQNVQARMGTSLDLEQARRLGLVDSALGQMIDRALIDQAGARLGLKVPDQAIRDQIVASPIFNNSLGQFDRFRFEAALANQGMNEAAFIGRVRRDLLRDQVIDSVMAGANTAPAPLLDALFRYRQERRVAEYFVIPNSSVASVADPSEEQLVAYHRENAGRFTAPELRALTWTVLSPLALIGAIEVPENEIADEYEARRASYVQAERRVVEQAVYPTEAAARAARDMLKDGLNFAAVAAKTLKLKATDLNLGKVTREQLPAALAVPVFNLPQDQVSDPLQSSLGWHLVRVTSIEPSTTKSLAEARDEIKHLVALRIAADRLIKSRNKMEDTLAGGATLEEASLALGFKTYGAPPVDSQGRDVLGRTMPDLPRLRAFLPAAFDAVERGDLDVREAEDGAYFVVRVDQITPPQLRPLDEVRAAAINTWKATERATFVAKQANTLADSLKDGADFQNLARDANASVEVSPPLTRDGLGGASKLSPLVLANLFRIDVGRAAVGATAAGDGQIVARLVRVEAADPAADTAQRDSQRQSIAATIAEDLVTQFRAQLEARIGVTIDRAVLEAATF